jgi:endonuclease/exonuclease/phosphatase family metal-dependent hydrolase
METKQNETIESCTYKASEHFPESTKFHRLMDLHLDLVKSVNILTRKEIKILTYNIFLRPPPVKNNLSDYKDDRLNDFCKILNDYDIICLQEMFGTFTSRRQHLIEQACQSGIFFHADVAAPSFFSKNLIDPGLLILSRFPIIESEFKPFMNTVLQCSVVCKGVLYAKIRIKDATNLIVFNLHLQATYFDSNSSQWDLQIKTRINQIEELNEYISHLITEQKIGKNDKILLLGDFNIDAHGLKYKVDSKFDKKILNEYEILMEKLNQNFKTTDLVKKKYNIHPFTYGVTGDDETAENLEKLQKLFSSNVSVDELNERSSKSFCETLDLSLTRRFLYDLVLTDKSDRGRFQSLDYIFEICLLDSESITKLQINYDSIRVEEFLIEERPYQQLSDHFGISISLYIEENSIEA